MTQQGPIIFNGRYELHSRLGRGGMAEVYLARDQMLDRPVAVKVLFPALATDPGFVERFRREAQSAAALNHPNIVGVYDWGEANGTYFIVMEYVEGESLAELIHAEGRLHPDRAAEIGADIASALGFAHRNGGVIHRDVKPGNVLITRDGDVKVADFGIARAISDTSDANLTKTGSVMGTATYFSPEQARGAAIDPRSDLYSLGCVLYEMVIGRPPFAGENAVAIAYKHVQEPPPPPRQLDPAVPDTLEAIILKCLAKNPDNRYPAAPDLRADLRRYLDGARIMAEPVMAAADPGATGVMAPTGYMQPTSAMSPYDDDPYGDDPYDDAYGDEDEDEKRSKGPLIFLVLLLLLLAGLLLWWALAGRGGETTAEVSVPELIGLSQEAAVDELEDNNLEADVRNVNDVEELAGFGISEDEAEVGHVIGQDPDAGEMLDEGDTVTISIWQGSNTGEIPPLEGVPEDDARTILRELGFTNITTELEESDEIEENHVIRTDPAAGQEVDLDSAIALIVSSGEDLVTVPGVVGRSQGDAEAAIGGAGLTVGGVTRQNHPDIPVDHVISSSPGEGADVRPGTAIALVVSDGPEEQFARVPNVIGETRSNAEALITQRNLNFQVLEDTTQNPNEDGRVIRQDPAPDAERPEGDTVTIWVGRYTGDGNGDDDDDDDDDDGGILPGR